jgi:hypothetical protein
VTRARAYLDTCIVSGLAKADLAPVEQDAVMYLLQAHKQGELKLVTSEVTAREISQIPEEFRRAHSVVYSLLSDVPTVLLGSTTSLSLMGTPGPGREDPMFENLKCLLPDPQDAEHVFQAAQNGVQYFVTVDRSTMLKHAAKVESACKVKLVAPSTLKGLVSHAS